MLVPDFRKGPFNSQKGVVSNARAANWPFTRVIMPPSLFGGFARNGRAAVSCLASCIQDFFRSASEEHLREDKKCQSCTDYTDHHDTVLYDSQRYPDRSKNQAAETITIISFHLAIKPHLTLEVVQHVPKVWKLLRHADKGTVQGAFNVVEIIVLRI